jgi:hypothetical protein
MVLSEEGEAVLGLSDQDGRPGFSVRVTEKGEPALSLNDRNGKPGALLHINQKGAPALNLFDSNGKGRVMLCVLEDEARVVGPTLMMFDQDRKAVWSAP